MNPIKFLGLVAFGYLGLIMVFGPNNPKTDETSPTVPPAVSRTVVLHTLPDDLVEARDLAIAEQMAMETSTTSTMPPETTTTLVRIAEIDPDTKCQEWLPLAVKMGWPNRTEVLQTLGRVIWKESRCQAISVDSEWFNGHDYGLTQINQIHEEWLSEMGWTLDDMAVPSSNLRFAYLLWQAGEDAGRCGWKPWSISC